MPVMVTATANIGASGAVSSYVGSMVATVAKQVAVGTYKITMQSKTNFSRLFYAQGSAQSPVSGLSGVATIEIQNAPNTSARLPTAELTIKCLDAAGALVNPADGSAINIMAIFSNSSVLIDGE